MPVGFKWYVKEIATDEHYILSDTKYEFDTEYQGQDVKVIDIKVNNGEVIKNNLIYGSVQGLKIDRETQEVISPLLPILNVLSSAITFLSEAETFCLSLYTERSVR